MGVAIVLIGVLTYYLTLTTRPEISQISPQPNSEQAPGPVELVAVISSQDEIDSVEFTVDGESIRPSIEQSGQNQWTARHEQVFDRGWREIRLEATDSAGRSVEHSWGFEAGGDLIPPRLALVSPPADVSIEQGTNGVQLHVTTFADIGDVDVEIDGQPVRARVEEAEPTGEYSTRDGMTIHEWNVSAIADIVVGTAAISVEVADEHGAMARDEWQIEVQLEDEADARFFEETEQYVGEPFLSYWEENDGEEVIGAPVGPPLSTEDGDQHQYFQYARLELGEDGAVHRGLIGREIFGDPETPPNRPPGDGARLFDPTGHYIHGVIREFWEENGGLEVFGYPLSQEFETDDGLAQYFERALIQVIEQNGEQEVELAPLGEQLYEEYQRGMNGPGADQSDDAEESD